MARGGGATNKSAGRAAGGARSNVAPSSTTATTAAQLLGAHDPMSVGGQMNVPYRFFMAEQPLSTMESKLLLRDHARRLTMAENAKLRLSEAEINRGVQQVILMLTIPFGATEQRLGPCTISSARDAEVHFKIASSTNPKLWSQETTAKFSRDKMLASLYYMGALRLAHAQLVTVDKNDVERSRTAHQNVGKAQMKFAWDSVPQNEGARAYWDECFADGQNASRLWPVFLEEVATKTKDKIDAVRIFMFVRGLQPLNDLSAANDFVEQMTERHYMEEKAHTTRLGYSEDKLTDKERKELNQLKGMGAQDPEDDEEGDGEGQGTLDQFLRGQPGFQGGTQSEARAIARANLREALDAADPENETKTKVFKHFGLCWDESDPERRDNLQSLLPCWEYSMSSLVKPHFNRAGHTRAELEPYFAHLWEGDKLVFSFNDYAEITPSARTKTGELDLEALLDVDVKQLYAERSFRKTGLVFPNFMNADYKHLGEFDGATRRVGTLQPAHFFPPHALNAWVSGEADTIQCFVGNYFVTDHPENQKNNNNRRFGTPSLNLHQLLSQHVEKARPGVRSALQQSPATHVMLSALLIGNIQSPVDLGEKFKGFPHPERVTVLSPELGHAWALPMAPVLGPPQTDKEKVSPFFWQHLDKCLGLAMPNTPKDAERNKQSLVRILLFDRAPRIRQVLSQPKYCNKVLDFLSDILLNRMSIRYAATTSVGMFREWNILGNSVTLPNVGKKTMHHRALDTEKSPFQDAYDLLGAEDSTAAVDTLTAETWDRLVQEAETVLKTRFLHLRHHIGSQTPVVEVSHFVKLQRLTMSVIPWRSLVKVVDATKREQRIQRNKVMLDILNGGTGDTMSLDRDLEGSQLHAAAWGHRDAAGGIVTPGDDATRELLKLSSARTATGAIVPAHGGWKMCGDLAELLESESTAELRRSENWNDFVGDYHTKLNKFVENVGLPYRLYESAFGSKTAKPAANLGRIVAEVQKARQQFEWFAALNKRNHARTLFLDKHFYEKNKSTRNASGASLPEAFAGVMDEWYTAYGIASNVSEVPYDDAVNGHENIRSTHAAMVALQDDTFKESGLGQHGMTYMLSAAHLVYEAMMTSCVMSVDRDRLGQLHLLFPGGTAAGKSTMVHRVLKLFISKSYTDLGSFSPKALQTRQDSDGLAIYFDEAQNFMDNRKDGSNNELISFMKRVITCGSDSRLVLEIENGDRHNVYVDSSHRRLIIACVNIDVSQLDKALRARFLIVPMRSYISPESQPLADSLPANAGQGVAPSDRERSEKEYKHVFFWRMVHAIKVIIEQFIHQGLLNVEVASMVDYIVLLISSLKNKINYEGPMARTHQNITLVTRSRTVTHAAFRVALEFFRQHELKHNFSACSHMPFEFILEEAQKHLFATKDIANYVITLLFRDVVDNVVHAELLLFLVRSKMLKGDVTHNLSLRREILPGVDDIEDGETSADPLDAHPPMEVALWSNNRRAARRHKHAVDLNFVPIVFENTKSLKAAASEISARMDTVRYTPEQVKNAILEMANQRFVVMGGDTDYNCLYAQQYDDALRKSHQSRLMSNGQTAYGNPGSDEEQKRAEARKRLDAMNGGHSSNASNGMGDNDGDGDGPQQSSSHFGGGSDVGAISFEDALLQSMPLFYHRSQVRVPLARFGQIGGQSDRKFYIAFHRNEVEFIVRSYKSDATSDYPITSTLIRTLSEQLNKTSPKIPYPPQVVMPPNARLTETIITGYSLNTNATYVTTRVNNATQTVLGRGVFHPQLQTQLNNLGVLLERHGCTLTAATPLIVTHQADNGKVVMTYQNESASHSTTRFLKHIKALEYLRDENVQSFGAWDFVNNPTNLLWNSADAREQRLLALNNDWLKRAYMIDQDIRHIYYDADWENFVNFCYMQQPALDPLDPANYETLPLIWMQLRISEYQNVLKKPASAASFPLQGVEHQLKKAVFKQLMLKFKDNIQFARRFHPDAHLTSTLMDWLTSAATFLNDWLNKTAPVVTSPPPPAPLKKGVPPPPMSMMLHTEQVNKAMKRTFSDAYPDVEDGEYEDDEEDDEEEQQTESGLLPSEDVMDVDQAAAGV